MSRVCRRSPGQEYIRMTLGDIIEDLAEYNKALEIDSLKVITCVMIGEMLSIKSIKPRICHIILNEYYRTFKIIFYIF